MSSLPFLFLFSSVLFSFLLPSPFFLSFSSPLAFPFFSLHFVPQSSEVKPCVAIGPSKSDTVLLSGGSLAKTTNCDNSCRMFSGFLGGGLISTSEHESADSHGGSRSQSPAVSVCAKHCERCKDLKHVVRFCSFSLYILWVLHLFLILMPVPSTWPPCVQGPLLEAADAKNRDQASHGSLKFVMISHLTRMIQHEVR